MLSYRPRTPPSSTIISDRSLTPPNSSIFSGDDHAGSGGEDPVFTTDSRGYIPHIFDLITPSREAAKLTTKHIPAIFLQAEAVDSSVLLGHGASFTASVQKLPKGPDRVEFTTHNPGWSVTKSVAAPPRPDCIVYKVARVAFKENGVPLPEYRRALQSVLTEYHALIYPPLFHHPNIIDFLGFAWGSNPFSPAQKLPAIVIEYAEHGTLADLLGKNRMMDFAMKHVLCLDTARGIAALHTAGLVHGDVKAENVLICSGISRRFVAKIADFGFSIVEATESAEVWMGGTNPWRAPETKNAVHVEFIRQTDTYSLGLLLWLVCVDGRWPFDFLVPATIQGSERIADIERLKQSDKLLDAAKSNGWLMSWLQDRFRSDVDQMLRKVRETLVNMNRYSEADLERESAVVRERLFEKLYAETLQLKLVKSLNDVFEHSLQVDPGKRNLSLIVLLLESDEEDTTRVAMRISEADQKGGQPPSENKFTIKNTSSEERRFVLTRDEPSKPKASQTAGKLSDQTASISILKNQIDGNHQQEDFQIGDEESCPVPSKATVPEAQNSTVDDSSPEKVEIIPKEAALEVDGVAKVSSPSSLPSWTLQGYKSRSISWQKMRTLDPGEQNMIFKSFRGSSEAELFILCSFLLNGYGCDTNVDDALKALKQAGDKGHHISRAYMYRIFSACRPTEDEVPGYDYLYDYAVAGSRSAFEDLWGKGPAEKAQDAHRFLTDACAGVGAPWFDRSEMLHGHTQSQWINDAWLLDKVKKVDDLSSFVVNKRGDSVLHFVAACGRWKPFKSLIEDYKMDINILNPQGETPLLCACRSGQGGIAIMCLQTYKADASLAAKNGETPLHWLISFVDQYVQPLAIDLIANGANVNATTHERISHSKFPGNIDVDFQMPSTPLGWAVHHNRPKIVQILLTHGADPQWKHAKGEMNPIMWAAYYHHDQCLKAIIEHLEGKVTAVTSDGKIDKRKALMFGSIIEEAIHASDKFSMILRNGPKYLNRLHATLDLLREKTEYVNTQAQFQGNMLYFAVSEAHDEVVGYMFEHNWQVETLNDPCLPAQRTPILEAIRWNRRPLVEVLLKHGADPLALASNPFEPKLQNWSALHIFAQEGHDKNHSLLQMLASKGVPMDGPTTPPRAEGDRVITNNVSIEMSSLSLADVPAITLPCETPFAVALRHNAFNLCSTMLSLGANPNSLTHSSGLFSSPHALTILGHIIISNARYSSARLKYLLRLDEIKTADFIVEPARELTALHRAAMAYQDVASVITGERVKMQEFDMEINQNIMYELLLRWPEGEKLDARCKIRGNTALHLAVDSGNVGAVESLVKAGADANIVNADGEMALQLASRLAGHSKAYEEILVRLRRVAGSVKPFEEQEDGTDMKST